MDRTVLHCDCNSYYASVELLSHPELRDKPVAVCGDPSARHGVILAKNERAKRFGVKTAETIISAQRKCPGLIMLPPHHELYGEYCRRINGIYAQYTDLVEQASVDESYLDVTASRALFGTGEQIADELRARVKAELGLTISVGVSFNKMFAKLGSDYKKPDATTVITRDNFKSILYPLPIGNMMYVGRASAELLRRAGIFTLGDVHAMRRGAHDRVAGQGRREPVAQCVRPGRQSGNADRLSRTGQVDRQFVYVPPRSGERGRLCRRADHAVRERG